MSRNLWLRHRVHQWYVNRFKGKGQLVRCTIHQITTLSSPETHYVEPNKAPATESSEIQASKIQRAFKDPWAWHEPERMFARRRAPEQLAEWQGIVELTRLDLCRTSNQTGWQLAKSSRQLSDGMQERLHSLSSLQFRAEESHIISIQSHQRH